MRSNKRKTTEQFIVEAKAVHGGKYGYEGVEYTCAKSKVSIVCPVHGVFDQTPNSHLNGRGCPCCAGTHKGSTEDFIVKATAKHEGRYNYEQVQYTRNNIKVKILCKEHGIFEQTPANHLSGQGCPECGGTSRGSVEIFIEKAEGLHGNKYDYSLVHYVQNKIKIKIRCKEHGLFEQTPANHLTGYGCPLCAIFDRGVARRANSAGLFRERAEAVHGEVYGYDEVKYERSRAKVRIMCNKHGNFWQEAASHLMGSGCPKCANHISKAEVALADFVRKLKVVVEVNNRVVLGGKEIDIYIPEAGLAIEYNGSYWHSEKNFGKRDVEATTHLLKKQVEAARLGINLLQVMDYDNPAAIRKLIVNRLGLTGEKIGARKCKIELRKSNSPEVIKFMESNHVQGGVNAGGSYCLIYRGSLVAVMSFSRAVSRRGLKANNETWELRRYATVCSVPGGASRLLKSFIKDHPECKKIISYSDNRLFEGGMYEKIGFSLIRELAPDYKYTKGSTVRSKGSFRRSELAKMKGFEFDPVLTEVENCWKNGWYRIWDCGKKVWEMEIK